MLHPEDLLDARVAYIPGLGRAVLLDADTFTPRQVGRGVIVTNNITGLDVARVRSGTVHQARMLGPDHICTCGECE